MSGVYGPLHLKPFLFDDEEHATATSQAQQETEATCGPWLLLSRPSSTLFPKNVRAFLDADNTLLLLREAHISYLMKALEHELPSSYTVLDASRAWICYWVLHALDLLGAPPCHLFPKLIELLAHFQNGPDSSRESSTALAHDIDVGGFGGGEMHYSHTASTYASVLALLTIGTPEAYAVINRKALYRFYMSCKQPSGGFTVQSDGEVDVRGAYTVIAISHLLNIATPKLLENTPEFLLSCQTYEGGFAGEPGNEGHGGYTFCGVAGLGILNHLHGADSASLARWLAHRQMQYEGGYSGRPNKLVDACYSFWQAGAARITEHHLSKHAPAHPATVLNSKRLQEYILCCAQAVEGGLRDKPSSSRDHYHTCYALSGLSTCQYTYDADWNATPGEVVGAPSNLLRPTHPMFNICVDKVIAARKYFEACEPVD